MRSVVILVPYFGTWPEWFELYLESCRLNPTIDWVFFTDCPPPSNQPKNVRFCPMPFAKYCDLVSRQLGITFSCVNAFKLCDIRPTLGVVHANEIKGYDNWGYGDIDVIYGNLRRFYTDKILESLVVSAHDFVVSGHLAILKNNDRANHAFEKVKDWRQILENPDHQAFDEKHFSRVFSLNGNSPGRRQLIKLFLFNSYWRQSCFKEQYSTILIPKPWLDGTFEHPQIWYWKEGHLTNNKDGAREFAYFHFMNWKSGKYLMPPFAGTAAWEGLEKINFVTREELALGWKMTRQGFFPLSK